MAYNGFAIDEYLDATAVTKQLDALVKKPVYTVKADELKKYEEEYTRWDRRTMWLGCNMEV